MRIGGVDVAAIQDNMKRFHRNSSQKRARVEVAPIENINNLITSSENESSSQSPSEFEQSSETEEECAGPSYLVSSDVCKLTDKKMLAYGQQVASCKILCSSSIVFSKLAKIQV